MLWIKWGFQIFSKLWYHFFYQTSWVQTWFVADLSFQYHGPLCVCGVSHWEVRPWLLQWDLPLHHVWGAALCGPNSQALHWHLLGECVHICSFTNNRGRINCYGIILDMNVNARGDSAKTHCCLWSYEPSVFQVRETGELELEEELYSKLIFLYRSPETMIKWTRDIMSPNQDG